MSNLYTGEYEGKKQGASLNGRSTEAAQQFNSSNYVTT